MPPSLSGQVTPEKIEMAPPCEKPPRGNQYERWRSFVVHGLTKDYA